jgi:cytochrome c oxidase subunit 2
VKTNLIVRLVVIGAVLLVAGYLATLAPWMPVEAAAEAQATGTLFRIMILIGTIIFLIVEGGLVYSILRFGKKPNDETDGPPIHGSLALEVIWTIIPAIIVLFLSIASFQVFAQTQTARDNELVVKVRGYQFAWEFTYEHDPNKQVRASDKLVLPVNRPVRFEITASDVMHGFWIPEFRIKQDAVPGRLTEVRALPTVKGDYGVVCYELCGSGHGVMRAPVQVVDQQAYDEFVASLEVKPPTKPGPEGSPEWGKYLIISNKYGCGGCHYLPDAGIVGVTGPSWVGVGDRAATRVAGQDAKTYVQHSILYPNEYVVSGYPANVMPQNYSALMDDTDLNSIVAYLLQQKAEPAKAAQNP